MSTASSRATLVMVTAGSEEQAATIGRALVGERLAACVNIVGPIRSIYRWQGEVQNDSEHLMLIKTRPNKQWAVSRELRRRIKDRFLAEKIPAGAPGRVYVADAGTDVKAS